MTQSRFGAHPLHKAEGAKGEDSMACSLLYVFCYVDIWVFKTWNVPEKATEGQKPYFTVPCLSPGPTGDQ